MWCNCYLNDYLYSFIFLYPVIACFAIYSEERRNKKLEEEIKLLKEELAKVKKD